MSTQPMPWTKRSHDETVQLGCHLRLHAVGEMTVLFVAGLPVRRFLRRDEVELRLELAAMVSLALVTQAQVAQAGLVAQATFHRDCVAYRSGGVQAVLARTVRGRRLGRSKLVPDVTREIRRLHEAGKSNVGIGMELTYRYRTARSKPRTS